MEELQQKIIGLLEAAGGSLPYPDLLLAMDAFERQSLIRTLDFLKSEGVLTQSVTWDADNHTNLHEVQLTEA